MPACSERKILVVDDNNMTRAVVCQMLTALAYTIQGAEDGLEALRRFEQDKFDLVLTDIQMPYMDGWELTRRVKSIVPDIYVIAMTGANPAEIPHPLGECSPDRVLFKPLRLAELRDELTFALKTRRLKSA